MIDNEQFLITSFLIKVFATTSITIILYFAINKFSELLNYDKNYQLEKIIFFVIIFTTLNSFNSFFINYTRAKLKYNLIFKTSAWTAFLYAFLIIIIVYIFNADVVFFICANSVIILVQIICYAKLISLKEIRRKKRKLSLYLPYYFKNYFQNYTLPLTGNNFLGYLSKDHGPNVILGSFFGPEKIATLSMISYLFNFFHNNLGNFIQKIIPVYHNYRRIVTFRILKKIFFLGNFYYLLIGIFLIYSKDFYFSFMKLEINSFNSTILIILTLEFLSKFSNLYLSNLILLSKNTAGLLISNISRTAFAILFFYISIILNNFFIGIIGLGFPILLAVPVLLAYSPPRQKFIEIKLIFIITLFCYIAFLNYFILN